MTIFFLEHTHQNGQSIFVLRRSSPVPGYQYSRRSTSSTLVVLYHLYRAYAPSQLFSSHTPSQHFRRQPRVRPRLTLLTHSADRRSSAAPLPPYPPPDPLAYQIPNSPVILVFGRYLTQRRDETWIQNAIASGVRECYRHPPDEPLQHQVYNWDYKSVNLKVKPVAEAGGPRLTWGSWKSALDGIQEFLQKYDGAEETGVGVRMNFQILVKTNTRGLDAQFAVGKGLLEVV